MTDTPQDEVKLVKQELWAHMPSCECCSSGQYHCTAEEPCEHCATFLEYIMGLQAKSLMSMRPLVALKNGNGEIDNEWYVMYWDDSEQLWNRARLGDIISEARRGYTPIPQPAVGDEELRTELRKIVTGAMERGNMYDGCVASAEFNAEASKVVDTYLPMILTHLEAAKREALERVKTTFKDFEINGPPWASHQAKIQYEAIRDYILAQLAKPTEKDV